MLIDVLGCQGSPQLVFLQRHRSERLRVARVVALDVLGQVALVPEPLHAGGQQAPEGLLTGVLPLVRVQLRLGEEPLAAGGAQFCAHAGAESCRFSQRGKPPGAAQQSAMQPSLSALIKTNLWNLFKS